MSMNDLGKQWHRQQIRQFGKMHPSYEKYAIFLNKVLARACKKYAPQAIVQTRAKTLSSSAKKAIRKLPKSEAIDGFTSVRQWKEFFDPVNEFTDLCGARVVTQTQYEVDRICQFIRDNFVIDEDNSEDKRAELRHDQFGYLSVHYIVQVKDRQAILDVPAPAAISQLKAEIQVRTLLQHAWADVSHDSLYKHQFEVPKKWHRDMARLAAVLEAADKEFTQFVESLDAFAGNHTAYLSNEQIEEEFSQLDTILENEKDQNQRQNLTLRKAQIQKAIGKWEEMVTLLTPYANSANPLVLRELGNALCRGHRGSPSPRGKYGQGQRFLKEALKLDGNDAETWACLAWSWEPVDSQRAKECYSKAYGLKPTNPYYLASFLEFEIANQRDFSGESLLKPVLRAAIKTCRTHAEVSIELPWSLFTIGRFHMLLGEPYQSLSAYIEAVDVCLSPESGIAEEAIDEELKSLNRLDHIKNSLEGFEWIRRLLLVAKSVKSRSKRLHKEVKELASKGVAYKGPVVIVAGSCSAGEEERLHHYRQLLSEALAEFQGEVISGGTTSGVSGIVGGLSELLEEKDRSGFKTVGYLPNLLPRGAKTDDRYDLILGTGGSGFSPLEPLQMWLDLLASGVQPSRVKLVGIGGGKIAAIEYRLALSLGAEVGVLAESLRAAKELLNDDRWREHKNLVSLIPDKMTIRALILSPSSVLDRASLERAAESSHNNAIKKPRHEVTDPSMEPWDKLDKKFKESSIQQKLYAEAILRYGGYGVRKKPKSQIKLIKLPKDRLKLMAEMEHGRFNVERIRAGWKLGEKRDHFKKISPYLRPWIELSDDVQAWDLDYVAGWPKDLKEAGLEVYDLKDEPKEEK